MSNFRDLIARMAIDPEFARHARANPDAVARQYHLDSDESEQLRGLADAAASAGPMALGARLSKMGGIISSSLISHFQATDPISPLSPIDPGSIHITPIDPDVVDPQGDWDHDGIPNILDGQDGNPDTSNEMWGDYDHDGIPNIDDPQLPHQFDLQRLMLNLSPDSDHDGIHDRYDLHPDNPDTSHEPLGDNDHDGIPNYLDRFTFPGGGLHIDPGNVVVLNPDPGGDHTPPPDGGDHTPPPGDGDHHTPPPVDTSTPVVSDVPQPDATPQQQPILLDGDALAHPVAPQAQHGIGEEALIVGGAALAGGAIVGGVAGVVLNRTKSTDEE